MQELIDKYRDKGLKMTPQRLAVLNFLDGNTDHPTADDIFRAVKVKYPTVSLATIYNTIQTLQEMGELQEVTINPERKHFDPNTAPHHHAICTKCKRIEDVFEDYSAVLSLPVEIHSAFNITGNHVDFYGECVNCQSSKH
jgi:Fur family peroxide stress response transcriptional regulator